MEKESNKFLIPEEHNADISSERVLANSESLMSDSEALRTLIELTHSASVEHFERATADPLRSVVLEKGNTLGLTEDEIFAEMETGSYIEKDEALRGKAAAVQNSFLETLKSSARIGVAAFAIGSSVSVFADNTHHAESPLTLTRSLEVPKDPLSQTREEVLAQMRNSVLAPTEKMGLFVKEYNEEHPRPVIVKGGKSNYVQFTEEDDAKIVDAMKSNTADIEIVHTHPLNTTTMNSWGVTDKDKHGFHHGEPPRIAMSPSTTDLTGMVGELSKYPPGQLSGRVIDPSGEWEYGIADSGAPFIVGMRKAIEETQKLEQLMVFTDTEREYMVKRNLQDVHPALLKESILALDGHDPLLISIKEKFSAIIDETNKISLRNIDPADAEKLNGIEGAFSAWMHPGTPEGDEEIARRERVASELGFRMKYTPNPIAQKNETADPVIVLKASPTLSENSLNAIDVANAIAEKNQKESSDDSSLPPRSNGWGIMGTQ